MNLIYLIVSLILCLLCLSAKSQTPSPSPEQHLSGVNARGDKAMGFSHEKATHHFHLFTDGESIEIASNDPADTENQKAIRDHLSMIATKFSNGDFTIPMFIHDTVPPGAETMKRLNSKIRYVVSNTAGGAQIRITSDDIDAIQAIHDFLKFQIEDHRTGDPLEVQK
jgi:TusA-related sulfurtransferase